ANMVVATEDVALEASMVATEDVALQVNMVVATEDEPTMLPAGNLHEGAAVK
ncbi:unnamed protein product, partial [Durusdinium trenchii]